MRDSTEASLTSLMLEVRKGSNPAFLALYRRCAPMCMKIIRRRIRDPDDALEALQDTFLRVWQSAHTYNATQSPAEHWLRTIARNAAIDRQRTLLRRNRNQTLHESEAAADLGTALIGIPGDIGEGVRNCLNELDPASRSFVIMALCEGMTHEEISRALGIPVNTSKSRLRRAVQKLRACLLTEGRGK